MFALLMYLVFLINILLVYSVFILNFLFLVFSNIKCKCTYYLGAFLVLCICYKTCKYNSYKDTWKYVKYISIAISAEEATHHITLNNKIWFTIDTKFSNARNRTYLRECNTTPSEIHVFKILPRFMEYLF